MSKGMRFTDEFKQDAVAHVVERGYAVCEVAERLSISTKSLYTWKPQSRPSHAPSNQEVRTKPRPMALNSIPRAYDAHEFLPPNVASECITDGEVKPIASVAISQSVNKCIYI